MPLFLCLGAAWLLIHLYRLASFPGLHFDEAWAANFAQRIASEPGVLPFGAQSPYTAAWGHWVAAAFFKILGPNLGVFRASQLTFVAAGVALLARTLHRYFTPKASRLFLVLTALFPALVLNHRFAIDVNTVHVLAFAMLVASVFHRDKRGDLLFLAGGLIGVTSHLLFLAPMAAAYVIKRATHPNPRWLGVSLWGTLALWFTRVAFLIPEKDKGWALVVGAATVAAIEVRPPNLSSLFRRALAADRLRLALLAVSFFSIVVFWDGSFAVLFARGELAEPPVWGVIPVLTLLLWHAGFRHSRDTPAFKALEWGWILLVAFLWILMVKPTERYFETAFLAGWFLIAARLAHAPRANALVAAHAAACVLFMTVQVISPMDRYVDREFRRGPFKDSSRDFAPLQNAVARARSRGCAAIRSGDARLSEGLRFLALTPATAAGDCYGQGAQGVRIERKSHFQMPENARLLEAFNDLLVLTP